MSDSVSGGVPAHSSLHDLDAAKIDQWLRDVSIIAAACGNAVSIVEIQATGIEIDGRRYQGCAPEVFQWGVEQLRQAVMPVQGGGMATDPYSRRKRVMLPGLRPKKGAKRQRVYGTSYHDAIIKIACQLYQRLAMIGLGYWETDIREFCTEDSQFVLSDVPEFREFSARKWPLELAQLVMDEARTADPCLNVDKLNVELKLEVDETHRKFQISSVIAHFRARHQEKGEKPRESDDPPKSNDSKEDEGGKDGKARRNKRSTVQNEGRDKLIAGLTQHHQWADGGCLNFEAVGVRELAKKCKVEPSTSSAFFKKDFGGHLAYRRICHDAVELSTSLKLLNGGFSPREFFAPPPHGGKDDPND